MQYDVKFGPQVVMTLNDVEAATALALALDEAAKSGFQTEGLRSHVIECNREAEVEVKVDEYYRLNANEAKEHIRENSDPEVLKEDILREKAHPRYDGGRSSVLDDAEEYLGELLTKMSE